MKKLGLVTAFMAVFLMAGCTGITDALVDKAGAVNMKALDRLDGLVAVLDAERARLVYGKCLSFFPALMAYACQSPEHNISVLQDCGLVVRCSSAVAVMADDGGGGP